MNGHVIAMAIVESVDTVETAGSERACAGCEETRELRLGPCREGASPFMPHVDPIDLAAVDCLSDPVQ